MGKAGLHVVYLMKAMSQFVLTVRSHTINQVSCKRVGESSIRQKDESSLEIFGTEHPAVQTTGW